MQSTCRRARAKDSAVLALVAAASLFAIVPAHSQEAACSSFDWPLKREFRLLSASDITTVESGGSVTVGGAAAMVKLRPMADVAFVQSPERQPRRADSFGAIVAIDSLPAAGLYQVTLSGEAWIDVLQEGQRVKSAAFSGRQGCAGMRKSVRFQLKAAPATIQISGASADRLNMVVTAAE